MSLDWFAALGLERRLVIAAGLLEQAYHERGRRVHPDRFASEAASVRGASLRSTAILTNAYRTLRDPVTRGNYWLELHGRKLADNSQAVPADLAETVFEVQEQLAELRQAGPSSSLRAEVTARRGEIQHRMASALKALAVNFAAWDRKEGGEETLFTELKTQLSVIAYLRTLVRDIDRTLEIAQAA
ncbi:MAG: hypothetical protein ABSG46_02035 [Candidatus Binataceae bacterium]